MRLIPVLFALVVAYPCPITAQAPADTTPALPASRLSFYFGGGVELVRLARQPSSFGSGLGLSLQGGATRQFGRLGLRLGLAYFERQRDYGPVSVSPLTGSSGVSASRTVAANADLTYDVTRFRIRPYMIGGLSLYRASLSSRFDDGTKSDYTRIGVALVPGIGLRVPLRNAEAFTEARFHLFSGPSRVILPLTFGIRF